MKKFILNSVQHPLEIYNIPVLQTYSLRNGITSEKANFGSMFRNERYPKISYFLISNLHGQKLELLQTYCKTY